MFGAVCSGRPVQLASQVEPAKYIIAIPNAANVNFITIFLLPNSEFIDPNYTALIYFQLANSNEFKLLGGINPNKPSAIYKLSNLKPAHSDDDLDIDDVNTPQGEIQIGISIETTARAEVLLEAEKAKTTQALVVAAKPVSDTAGLANRIVGHAYNYLGSFIDESGKVPMRAFDSWWDKFKTKLANNPSFLDEL